MKVAEDGAREGAGAPGGRVPSLTGGAVIPLSTPVPLSTTAPAPAPVALPMWEAGGAGSGAYGGVWGDVGGGPGGPFGAWAADGTAAGGEATGLHPGAGLAR